MLALSQLHSEGYSTAFLCATGIVAASVVVVCCSRIAAVSTKALFNQEPPSNFTVEQLSIQPVLSSDIIFDPEDWKTARQVASRILNLAKESTNKSSNGAPVKFQITEFTYKDEGANWNRQLTIEADRDQFLFCYAVAILDFVYKYRSNFAYFDSSRLRLQNLRNPCISVLQRAMEAMTDTEMKLILSSTQSMEYVVNWLKSLTAPGTIYEFNEKSLPQIENLFKTTGLALNIAREKSKAEIKIEKEKKEKEEEYEYAFITGIPKEIETLPLKDIYITTEAGAELV